MSQYGLPIGNPDIEGQGPPIWVLNLGRGPSEATFPVPTVMPNLVTGSTTSILPGGDEVIWPMPSST